MRIAILAGAAALALGAAAARAQSPQGGMVVGGEARVVHGAGQTTIAQRSRRAIVDWRGFDVGPDHRVEFDQPGRAAATLNRVRSATPSVIAGSIRAPGTVIIQNPAGVAFTGSARVDVGSLVATSHIVDADRFRRDGALRMEAGGRPGAGVRNAGTITVGEAGLAALVGHQVENSGTIVAEKGTVALASGLRAAIDLTGDGMVRIAVDGAAGNVSHSGLIDAPDGRVLLSAAGAAGALDAAINTTGVIRAGAVELVARGSGRVSLSGSIDVSGPAEGGAVAVTGETIALERTARIDARGGSRGGSVRIGGDLRGDGSLRRATALTVARGAAIAADGGDTGGMVVLWSDGETFFDGAITATGGRRGGLVETSGAFALGIGASASVSLGRGGSWLLDPRDVVIGDGGAVPPGGTGNPPAGPGPFVIDRLALAATLDAGSDVTITTHQPAADDPGDITLARPLAWTGPGSLRLEGRDIGFAAPVTTRDGHLLAFASGDIRVDSPVTSTGRADLRFDAAGSVAVDADLRATGTGTIAIYARTGDVAIGPRAPGDLQVSTASGALVVSATAGSVRLRREAAAGDGITQLGSDAGDVVITAGTAIDIAGGDRPGRRVRVGRAGSSSYLTLVAPSIDVIGGSATNAFAEVIADRAAGLTMEARHLTVRNGASEGRVAALNRAGLTLRAETQAWDGPVRAGNSGQTGGHVLLSGAITASVEPRFGLASGRSFTLLPRTRSGDSPSSYTSPRALSVSTSGTGAIEIGAPVTAATVTLLARERVGLGVAASLAATGAGDALVVSAGRRFRNDAGAGVLVTGPDARWLLYVDRFDGITGAKPGPREFDLYGRNHADSPPPLDGLPGNRVIYDEVPVLTVTAGSTRKTYGTVVAPGFTLSGLRPDDSAATALASGPDVTSPGTAAGASVGSHVTQANATPSDQGYELRFVDGSIIVDPARLTVTTNPAARTYGAANPAFTASFAGLVAGDQPGDLDGGLTFATAADVTSGAGRYDVTPGGLASGNYVIDFAPGTLTVDKAPLRVTVNDASRPYGAANPALTARFSGFVLGEDAGALGGALSTTATAASNAGRHAITASGLTSANYAIEAVDGALTVTPAPLTVAANDASRPFGAANPAFSASFAGFVLGQDAGDLAGALGFATPAQPSSPAGSYAIIPGGLASGNYAITFLPGVLTVAPPDPPGPAQAFAAATGPIRYLVGVPPLTPGDASFRTTTAEAPPALANPFALTYSLGEVVQLAPTAGTPAPAAAAAGTAGFAPAAGTGGFVPAAGGAGFQPAAGGPVRTPLACGGPVNGGGSPTTCERRTVTESYWTTVATGAP